MSETAETHAAAMLQAADADDLADRRDQLVEEEAHRLVTDQELSPHVARLLLDGLYAEVCLEAVAAVLRQAPLAPWLADTLCAQLRTGLRSALRLLASVPGFRVPETRVPAAERLDLAQLAVNTAAANRGIQLLFDQARASGLPIYLPFGDEDDD